MGWSIGYDDTWKRDIGYGVPAICDFPRCGEEIDRGLSFVCGGEPYGGEHGCGGYFCSKHLGYRGDKPQQCSRCINYRTPFNATPDTPEWLRHKLTDESWADWRAENKALVRQMWALLPGEKP